MCTTYAIVRLAMDPFSPSGEGGSSLAYSIWNRCITASKRKTTPTVRRTWKKNHHGGRRGHGENSENRLPNRAVPSSPHPSFFPPAPKGPNMPVGECPGLTEQPTGKALKGRHKLNRCNERKTSNRARSQFIARPFKLRYKTPFPRQAKVAPGGLVYPGSNSSPAGPALFRKEAAFEAFERIIKVGKTSKRTKLGYRTQYVVKSARGKGCKRKSCVPVSSPIPRDTTIQPTKPRGS